MNKAGGKKKNGQKKALVSKNTMQAKGKKAGSKPAAVESAGGEIPKLDLGTQILANERKVTSVRRKGPGAKSKATTEVAEAASEGILGVRTVPELAEEDRVIAEIVARDIRRLCEG